MATAQLMGAATQRILVGTWIANIYLRHSYTCAQGAALIADATAGRFILGLGVSHQRFSVRGAPDQGVDLAEVALAAFKPQRLPEGFDLGLDETAFHEPANLSYPSGAHCCIVEVDRETGRVEIRRYVAVDDCGTVINPLLAKGQIHGGVAQGIAQALLEEVRYGDDGQPITGTLVDYTVPAAPDLPRYETDHIETRTSFNPLGAKGLGESGATAAPQAVVNAVVDALSHLGVRNIDMPCTPQKVWRLVQSANGS